MAYYDGVNFGSDLIGAYGSNSRPSLKHDLFPHPGPRSRIPQNAQSLNGFYPNEVTQFYPSPGVYAPDMTIRPWSDDVDHLALSSKLAENEMRDSYQKRSFMTDKPPNHCQCDMCNKPLFSVNIMFCILIFVMIVFLAMHYNMCGQIDHLKDLLRLK